MAEPVDCEICGKELDPRGLRGHLRFGHGLPDSYLGSELPFESTKPGYVEDVSQLGIDGSPYFPLTILAEFRITELEAQREFLENLQEQLSKSGTEET